MLDRLSLTPEGIVAGAATRAVRRRPGVGRDGRGDRAARRDGGIGDRRRGPPQRGRGGHHRAAASARSPTTRTSSLALGDLDRARARRCCRWRSQHWRGRPLRNTARFAAAFSAGALFLKLLVLLHPNMPVGDAMFHAHRFQGVLAATCTSRRSRRAATRFRIRRASTCSPRSFAGLVRRGAGRHGAAAHHHLRRSTRSPACCSTRSSCRALGQSRCAGRRWRSRSTT